MMNSATLPDQLGSATDSAVTRLRSRLRDVLAVELPRRVDEHRGDGPPLTPSMRRELASGIIDAAITSHNEEELRANRSLLSPNTEAHTVIEVLNEVFGLAGLQPLLDDPTIETININGHDRVFVQYDNGRRAQLAPVATSDAELVDLVRTLAARASTEERRFDRGSPAVNVQLPAGERLFAVMALTAAGRPALSIRRHRFRAATLADLVETGTVDIGLRVFLTALVRARRNILITGGTGVGKTTLLRALASEFEPAERIVTIEDVHELHLGHDPIAHPDVVALQAREANIEGEGEVTQSELVRWALRMTPDRVIVGEIRGPEVVPMCNAMSQGNDGSMATLHASSSQIAFNRLASYAAQGPERLPHEATNLMIVSAVHFVVHIVRATDGVTRVVSSVREVVGAEGIQVISNEVYRPGPDRRATPVPGALRRDTAELLSDVGFDPLMLENSNWRRGESR
ncbi:CpaF family protein [Actinophytocola oryzae]|uniref:Flp pilus assembly CpaF family ATPase n=1 Tax=Actinophytocola oryzae TaxID=502181 RepID=A0A4R7V492_9PSEU|nr:ATPase, T2SS/T4P/T4SS family [Actinophytocola oryzae]TDV44169.1 Flp pilus assembly CpaF family ATPase [Actinophytocola oryzae]